MHNEAVLLKVISLFQIIRMSNHQRNWGILGKWKQEDLVAAKNIVDRRIISLNAASKQFYISRRTLQNNFTTKWENNPTRVLYRKRNQLLKLFGL